MHANAQLTRANISVKSTEQGSVLPQLSPWTVFFFFFAVYFYILPPRQGKISIEFACGYFDLGRRGGATVASWQEGKKSLGFRKKKNKKTSLSILIFKKVLKTFFFKYTVLEISGHQKVVFFFFFFLSFIEQTQTERCLWTDWPRVCRLSKFQDG